MEGFELEAKKASSPCDACGFSYDFWTSNIAVLSSTPALARKRACSRVCASLRSSSSAALWMFCKCSSSWAALAVAMSCPSRASLAALNALSRHSISFFHSAAAFCRSAVCASHCAIAAFLNSPSGRGSRWFLNCTSAAAFFSAVS